MSAEVPAVIRPALQRLEYVEHLVAEEVTQTTWRDRLRQIGGRLTLVGALALGTGVAIEATQPAPAQAHEKSIGACRGPFWGLLAQQTCVNARMGEKDFTNHKEWVGNVEVVSPDSGQGFLEIWGDGFYESRANATRANWDINKFVASNTNICGAGTDGQGFREVACFHINVE